MTAITGKPAKIYTAYFSPTGGTKKAALALTSALADTDRRIYRNRFVFTCFGTVYFRC